MKVVAFLRDFAHDLAGRLQSHPISAVRQFKGKQGATAVPGPARRRNASAPASTTTERRQQQPFHPRKVARKATFRSGGVLPQSVDLFHA